MCVFPHWDETCLVCSHIDSPSLHLHDKLTVNSVQGQHWCVSAFHVRLNCENALTKTDCLLSGFFTFTCLLVSHGTHLTSPHRSHVKMLISIISSVWCLKYQVLSPQTAYSYLFHNATLGDFSMIDQYSIPSCCVINKSTIKWVVFCPSCSFDCTPYTVYTI